MPDAQETLDPNVIRPGQRYAFRDGSVWRVGVHAGNKPISAHHERDPFHPLIEPADLPRVKVGSEVLNVATGERFVWTEGHVGEAHAVHFEMQDLAPLLALVSVPEEDSDA